MMRLRKERLGVLLLCYLALLLFFSLFSAGVFIWALSASFFALLVFFVFFRPKLALMLHVFLIPFAHFVPRMPFFEAVSVDTFIEILLLGTIAFGFLFKGKGLFQCRQNAAVALFFAVAVFSINFSASPADSIFALVQLAHSVVLFFLVSNLVETKKDALNLFLSLFLSGALAAVFSLFQLFSGNLVVGTVPGIYMESNFTAAFLLALLPIAVFLFLNEKAVRLKALHGFGVALVLFALLVSFSRAAMLALSTVFLLLLFKFKSNARSILFLAAVALIVVSLLPTPVLYSAFSSFGLTSNTKRPPVWDSFFGRVKINAYSVQIFLANFFTGVGIGNYPLVFERTVPQTDFYWKSSLAPHSIYMQVAAELGVFGLLFFLLLLAYTFIDIKNRKQPAGFGLRESLFLSLIGFLVMGFSINPLNLHVFWIALALAPVFRQKQLY